MSYCRWSSDNWKSDVYVYEGDGYVIHVAARRRKRQPIPGVNFSALPTFGCKLSEEARGVVYPSRLHRAAHLFVIRLAMLWNRLHMMHLRRITLEPIGGFWDGQTLEYTTPGDCADALEGLRMAGYHVPQYAIDQLRAEQCGW